MSTELIDPAALTFRFVLAFVLLAAAMPKLLAPRQFERAVANYGLLPARLVRPVAVWLPRVELAFAVALLLGLAVAWVATATAGILAVFAGAVAVNLVRGRRIECGCSGTVSARRIGWRLVVGDVALAAMAVAVAVRTEAGSRSADAVAALILAGSLVLVQLLASSWLALRSQALVVSIAERRSA